MNITFDYHSNRAKKARLGRALLKKPVQILFVTLIATSAVLGLVCVVLFGNEGALFFLPFALLLPIELWAKGELGDLPANLGASTDSLVLHEALDRRALGKIKDYQNPKKIWNSIRGSWRSQFIINRYGIGQEALDTFLSETPEDAQKMWESAVEMAHHEGQNSITTATITVALISVIPRYEDLLAHLHLEPVDLIVGIDWQRHVELVIERMQNKNHFGGFGRDWSSGYTPILSRLAHNISSDIQAQGGLLYRETDAHQQAEQQIIHNLGTSGRPCVALIGEVGSGKTTAVSSLAEKLLMSKDVPPNLQYNQVFSLNAPSLLAHIKTREQLEGAVLQIFSEAAAAKNIIIFLDDANTFFKDGPGSVDLSNIMMPVIEGGAVRLIMAMTPQEWQELSVHNSALTGMLNRVTLQEADADTTKRVMEDQVLLIEYKNKVSIMYQALLESYRLADRYVNDMAFPGKAVRMLENAASFSESGVVTEKSVQRSIESSQGVKIQTADAGEKEKLVNLEDQIHERMVNQTRAVKVVANALRRSRSGVTNPNKPIGTFLFLGPTGVGKTELSKAISDTYFGGETSIIRVDMNQYIHKDDVTRLLEPANANGAGLVSQITKRPFSVVLFDEIEKAHPDIINVFLQLLDEGTLKDTNNRNVSFKDSIIIATSNAGADVIRQKISEGKGLEEFEKQFVDDLISGGQFKPELLNRFDEIVLFRPLNEQELLQVVDILMANVNKTLARQKVTVELTQAAKQWLVQNGNDPRMGARPLRRMVQRSVENIVAQKLLTNEIQAGTTATLDVPDLEAGADGS